MCVQTGSVKEHLTGKVILEKIREYMGSRRTECHKRNYEKSGRSVKAENRCLHPTDNLVGWPRFYASFDNDTSTKTKAFSMKKGTRVRITKIYYNRKKLLVGVEYKGKFGWIIGGKNPKIRLNPLFKNLAFGG